MGRYFCSLFYTCSPTMLTPIRNAQPGTPDSLYTRDQCGTRCIVERTFADLTNKQMCISRRRVLHYSPRKVARIIVSAAVLHNFMKLNGRRPNNIQNERRNILAINEVAEFNQGLAERQRLIQLYYN